MPVEVSPMPTEIITPAPTPKPTPEPTPEPTQEPIPAQSPAQEDASIYYDYSYYPDDGYTTYDFDQSSARAGRLYIPGVGIDVGLNSGDNAQAIVDAYDSAWYKEYIVGDDQRSYIIGDHNNQGFSTLSYVSVGDEAYITNEDGSTTTLRCREVLDAHNDGWLVTDDGRVLGFEENAYVMYTCHGGGDGVRVCVFEPIE